MISAHSSRRGRSLSLLAAGALASALVAAGCGSDDDSTSTDGTDAASGTEQVDITMNAGGCDPVDAEVPAGPVTFDITNDGSSETEFYVLDGEAVLAERENILDGDEATLSLTLQEGDYSIRCANDGKGGDLTVTPGSTDATPELTEASDTYKAYVVKNTDELVTATKPFVRAVVDGDLEKAQQLYVPARIPYERIEPVAESFGDLDPRIDAREGDVPAKTWSGFHVLEQALFEQKTTDGMAPVAQQLQKDVEELADRSNGIELQAAQIANGANGLLDEVSASKITGEEERYSHVDLVDFQANVDGSQAAFEAVEPLLRDRDPELADEITQQFKEVNTALDPYRQGSGFVLYTELNKNDTKALSQSIDALAEPLSQVASQIVS